MGADSSRDVHDFATMWIQREPIWRSQRIALRVVLSIVLLSGMIHVMSWVEDGTASTGMFPASSRTLDGDELLRIGDLHEVQHHWQEALPYYQRALAAFREKRVRRGEAQALLKIGQVLERQNRLDEAFASVNESLRVLTRSRDWRMQARTLLQRGQIAEALERWIEASNSYEQAGNAFERAHDTEGRIEALVKWGALQVRQDQVSEGLSLLQGAYQEARQLSLLVLQMTALLGIGEAHLHLEDPDAARRSLEEGLALAQSLQEMKQEAVLVYDLPACMSQPESMALPELSRSARWCSINRAGIGRGRARHFLSWERSISIKAMLTRRRRIIRAP